MSYAIEIAKIAKTPNYIAYLTLDYCSLTFGVAPCTETGTPCYYTRPTCKDPANYAKSSRIFRFCLKGKPQPLKGEDVRPYIEGGRFLTTEIKPRESISVNAKVTLNCQDEENPLAFDSDKGAGKFNAGTAGTFWKNLKERYRNYRGRSMVIKRGFVVPGFTEGEYETIFKGILDNIMIGNDGSVQVVAKDILRKLRKKIPNTISKNNVLVGILNAGVTTIPVVNGSEFSTAFGDVSYGVVKIENEYIKYTGVSSNNLTGCTRGSFGTADVQHPDTSVVTEIIVYATSDGSQGLPPTDIMLDVIKKAGIDAADIDEASFDDQGAQWMASWKFKRVIDTPEIAEKLLQELRDQTMSSIWVSEEQKVTFKMSAPSSPGDVVKEVDDEANIVHKSAVLNDNEEDRITRVFFYFDHIPGTKGDRPADFNEVFVFADVESESDVWFDEVKEKIVYSKWVIDYGNALFVAARTVYRFRYGARRFRFTTELKDDDIKTGDFIRISSDQMLDQFGATVQKARFQILKKSENEEGRITFEALDTRLVFRYGFIGWSTGPKALPSDYDDATEEDKAYGFIGKEVTNKVGKNEEDGYYIW